MPLQARLKKWGNSLGIVIPAEFLRTENLKEGEEVTVEVKGETKKTLKDVFGSLKDWKIDSQKVKDELREEWDR